MNTTNRIGLTGLSLIITTSLSSAALNIYESFDYTAASTITGLNGGTGFTGAWGSGDEEAQLTILPTSLSYGTLSTTGGALSGTKAGSNVTSFRSFASQGGAASTTWMSFLLQSDSVTNGISLYNSSTENTFFGAIIGGYNFRFQNQAASFQTTENTGIDSNAHLLVIQLDQTGGTPVYNTWLDPDVSSLGTGAAPTGGTANVTNTDTTTFSFGSLRVGMFTANDDAVFDEIRIGDTWVDVSPVPEPSSTLLVVLGSLGMIARRRRV